MLVVAESERERRAPSTAGRGVWSSGSWRDQVMPCYLKREEEERRGEASAGVGVQFREPGSVLCVVGLFLARHVLHQLTEGAGLS